MSQQNETTKSQLYDALKQFFAFLEARGFSTRTEEIPVSDALGRVSARAVYAGRDTQGSGSGKMILESYLEIEPAMIAALRMGGVQTVSVLAKPRVGIVFEETPAFEREEEARSASAALYCAMLSRWGAAGVVYPGETKPDAEQFARLRAARECDLVLLCVDTKRDVPADVLSAHGELCVDGIAIHPGGDTALGAIGSVPAVCMADDPASGIVALEELVKPVLDRLLMRERTIAESVCVKMGVDYASAPDVRAFVRAKLAFDPEGSLIVLPIPAEKNTAEHLDKADCILDVPFGCAGYAAGERAHVRLLKPIDRIARTIRIRGDYDPMLDEAADELRRSDIRAYVDREAEDALCALEALQRGECHLCGVYLPDDADGIAWIAQRVPDGGVALVEGVRRLDVKENPPTERAYDLVVSLAALENAQVRAFLRVLGSDAFSRRLEARGGYRADKPGRIKKIWP